MSFPGFVQGVASFAEATSYDSFQSAGPFSTTSSGWVEVVRFTASEDVIDGLYSVQWSMRLSQSKGGRNLGARISFRPGNDGDANPWVILRSHATLQVASDNASIPYSGFNEVTLSTTGLYQVRFEFGQTINGGTQSATEINFVVFRVGGI